MLTKPRYTVRDMAQWTRWEATFFLAYAGVVAALFHLLGMPFFRVPWAPLAVIGTAVAFIVGFRSNSAYGRIWEARQIWGGIVNDSRTFGMKVEAMVTNANAQAPVSDEELRAERRTLVHRHIAWLAALRYAMRGPRKWEEFEKHKTNREWSLSMHIPERLNPLENELRLYLPEEEVEYVLGKSNRATALLYLQSRHLTRLKDQGLVWEFSFLELQNLLQNLFQGQGKSERIKNFPYPRQYATLSFYFVWVFIALLPLAVVPEFAAVGTEMLPEWPRVGWYFTWLAVPFCGVISWIFHVMERIARVGENPFEGSANDVPISTISRGIEIDLRQMLDEEPSGIPGPHPEVHDVQM